MTEEQIERIVEARTDNLDAVFMRGLLTETEYNERLKKIDDWANLARRTVFLP